MPLLIKYTAECTCGDTMVCKELDITQDGGDVAVINLDMLGDMTLECTGCGDRAFLPNVGDLIENVEK